MENRSRRQSRTICYIFASYYTLLLLAVHYYYSVTETHTRLLRSCFWPITRATPIVAFAVSSGKEFAKGGRELHFLVKTWAISSVKKGGIVYTSLALNYKKRFAELNVSASRLTPEPPSSTTLTVACETNHHPPQKAPPFSK